MKKAEQSAPKLPEASDNELFSEVKPREGELLIEGDEYRLIQAFKGEGVGNFSGDGRVLISWMYLMSVVEKMFSLWQPASRGPQKSINIHLDKFRRDVPIFSHIQQAHKEVVKFIKWYNANHTEKQPI